MRRKMQTIPERIASAKNTGHFSLDDVIAVDNWVSEVCPSILPSYISNPEIDNQRLYLRILARMLRRSVEENKISSAEEAWRRIEDIIQWAKVNHYR